MLTSMKHLRAWQQEHPRDFGSLFQRLLQEKHDVTGNPEPIDQLDSDRRRVSQFFEKVHTFSELGVINRRDVGRIWDISTYTFLSDVLMPMERAKTDALFQAKSITPADKHRADLEAVNAMKFWSDLLQSIDSVPDRVVRPPGG
jgi:hypothetical protein